MNTVEEVLHRISAHAARFAIVAAVVIGTVNVASAQSRPCDIYGAAGTTCVAAHSTTRALFAAYSGRLYQVRRASDGATTDVSTLAAGGFANAAAQDAFCAGTTCTITIIYDQSSRANHLTVSPAGGGWRPADLDGADATCVEWTDNCRVCKRVSPEEFACSNVAIACIQRKGQCTRR